MAVHNAQTPREKLLVERERQRALRIEVALKNALLEYSRVKKSYDVAVEENDALKAELANSVKHAKRLEKATMAISDNTITLILAMLDQETFSEVKTALRKAIHPDKHGGLSEQAKHAMGNIFTVIEEQLK